MSRVSYFKTTTVVDADQNTAIQQLLTRASAAENSLTGKADKSYVDSELAKVADATTVTGQLALKADATYVNAQLALKANITEVNSALEAKADAAAVTTALATKLATADYNTRKTYVNQFLTAFKEAIFLEDPAGSGNDFSYANLLQ